MGNRLVGETVHEWMINHPNDELLPHVEEVRKLYSTTDDSDDSEYILNEEEMTDRLYYSLKCHPDYCFQNLKCFKAINAVNFETLKKKRDMSS